MGVRSWCTALRTKKVIFVRHCESTYQVLRDGPGKKKWTDACWLKEYRDSPLSGNGMLQAAELSSRLFFLKPDLILCSPLTHSRRWSQHYKTPGGLLLKHAFPQETIESAQCRAALLWRMSSENHREEARFTHTSTTTMPHQTGSTYNHIAVFTHSKMVMHHYGVHVLGPNIKHSTTGISLKFSFSRYSSWTRDRVD